MYYIYRTSTAIGDYMITAFFVRLLNDNGIQAFYSSQPYYELVAVPKTMAIDKSKLFLIDYPSKEDEFDFGEDTSTVSIMQHMIRRFKQTFNINKDIKIKTHYVPINFVDIPKIEGTDVAMVTQSGHWTPYRNWPYFEELKKELNNYNIKYIDISKENIKNQECLNWVKKSKLYLGLETGTSHLVSQVVNNSLIIQSGYTHNNFWNFYNYDYISHDVDC